MAAKSLPVPDLDFYPPFDGFSKKTITFLKNLRKNNNRPWFEKHKEEFERDVKLPMQSMIVALQPHFHRFAPEVEVHPKRSLFRIYRDIRFSKDKSPYKTHVAAHFVMRGEAKGTEGSGYYFHIEPGQVFVGVGIYMPQSDQLKKIRKALAGKPDQFLSIVQESSFRRMFGMLEGEKLRRVPQGYEPDHPMAEWLKFKQFFVSVEWPESKCYKAAFVKEVATVFEKAAPLVKFLTEAGG
ncbi:MAG: DUF2461 domain-containing protein [Bacteroidota bacterium]